MTKHTHRFSALAAALLCAAASVPLASSAAQMATEGFVTNRINAALASKADAFKVIPSGYALPADCLPVRYTINYGDGTFSEIETSSVAVEPNASATKMRLFDTSGAEPVAVAEFYPKQYGYRFYAAIASAGPTIYYIHPLTFGPDNRAPQINVWPALETDEAHIPIVYADELTANIESATNALASTAKWPWSSITNAPITWAWSAITGKPTTWAWSAITGKPSWIDSSTKPSYTPNEIFTGAENWIGVQGNAGRIIKILAQNNAYGVPMGGVQVTASANNDNNTTTYALNGVAVKRSGVNQDYLWDTSATNGIVRRSELASYKPKQTAKTSPTASGNTYQFIDTVSQDTNGVITATKKSVRTATTGQTGIVQLSAATNSTSTTLAATPSAVKAVRDEIDRCVATNHMGNVCIVGSVAEGDSTTARGAFSHAEGMNTLAHGDGSHVEGLATTAIGAYAHAEGGGSSAGSAFSHAAGVNATATNAHAWVWHGIYATDFPYGSHGDGTFNVSPEGGLDGFWIGDTSLAQAIAAAKPESYDEVAAAALSAVQPGDIPTGWPWSSITNKPSWIGATKPSYSAAEVGAVPTSRTINGKALSANISLTAADVGAATPLAVTNIVRDLSLGGIWDEELEVWWTPRMNGGSLTYHATTNVNMNAGN